MIRTVMLRAVMTGVIALVAALAVAPAAAQNRQDQQMLADLRIVQEQVQRLRAEVGTLADQLKALTSKLDEQTNSINKSFADSRLLIRDISSNVTTLQENVRDNNVRVSQLTQEVSAIKKGVEMQMTLITQALTQSTPGSPAGSPPPGTQISSPSSYLDQAWGFYTVGQYDLAISAYQDFLTKFPDSPDVPKAQFYIGESYFNAGKYKEAVSAYNEVITKHKTSEFIGDAYLKQGLAHERLGQKDQAIRIYRLIRSQLPESSAAYLQATQNLRRLGEIK